MKKEISKLSSKQLCKITTDAFINKHELGSSDTERLRNLVAAMQDNGSISYFDAIAILYPESEASKAENNLRAFRKRVKAAAAVAEVYYEIQVSANRKDGNKNRKLWISAGSELISTAIDTIRESPNYNPDEYIENLVKDTKDKDENDNKKQLTFFVSYAHDDKNQKYNLIEDLKKVLPNKEYNILFWEDKNILIGEDFDNKIRLTLEECDYGLLLVTPAFLESEYIKDVEIPELIKKGLLPVGLKETDFKELKKVGIEKYQIFTYGDTKKMFYNETADDTRKHFLEKLKNHIINRIKEDEKKYKEKIKSEEKKIKNNFDEVNYLHQDLYNRNRHIPNRGRQLDFNLKKIKSFEYVETFVSRNVVLDELRNWQSNPNRPPVFALLGDFGTGKTFTTRIFADEAKRDKHIKPVFYCDLKWTPRSAENRIPSLKDIIKMTLEKAEIEDIDAGLIIERFRNGEIIVVFDGLDEKTVYMTDAEAQQFFNELMHIMPPKKEDRKKCRLLFTCRTHYFKTLTTQNNFFSGEQRGELGQDSFTGMEILMLTEEQIEEYLLKRFPDNPVKRNKVKQLLQDNESIRDLAKRPYLLSLICDVIPQIKEGEKLNLASIYNLFVELWYKRDDTKHQLLTRHKEMLLNDLAVDIWKNRVRSWPNTKLECWLDKWYVNHPDIHHFYSDKILRNADFLSDDIRTASFLVRYGYSDFRFAHTSMHEFFVARYMIAVLKENKKSLWTSIQPNKEIIDFFYALWDIDNEQNLLEENLLHWLESKDKDINKILFRIWLDKNLQNNKKINLQNVLLYGFNINSVSRKDMSYINLENATLKDSTWKNIDLRNANLKNFKIYDSTIEDVLFDKNVDTTQYPYVHKRKWIVNGKNILKEQFEKQNVKKILKKLQINTGHIGDVTSVAYSPDGKYLASGSRDKTVKIWDLSSGESVLILKGHSSLVTSVAYSPDGKQLASGSRDNTVKIWDLSSGESALTLKGHSSFVTSVAYSPDGKQLSSASEDNTVKIWDLSSGESVLTLKEHSSFVTSIAYSPDGKQLASGSWDNTVKIWDLLSGELVLTLKGHSSAVNSVAYSPDGKHLSSGSWDNTVKIWDLPRGETVLTLKGHSSAVNSVAYSPDGKHLSSGSWDNTVKIWDLSSGESVLTLKGHINYVNSVTYSPDGKHLSSGSQDKTVKIWDLSSGKLIREIVNIDQNSYINIDSQKNRVIYATGNAWKYMKAEALTADGEKIYFNPEFLEPIPGLD